MRVFIASVTHKYGCTPFVATTPDQLEAKVAAYCRDYWDNDGPRDSAGKPLPIPDDDTRTIMQYFESEVNNEYVEYGQDEL